MLSMKIKKIIKWLFFTEENLQNYQHFELRGSFIVSFFKCVFNLRSYLIDVFLHCMLGINDKPDLRISLILSLCMESPLEMTHCELCFRALCVFCSFDDGYEIFEILSGGGQLGEFFLLFLPLLNAILCGFFGRFLGSRGAVFSSVSIAFMAIFWPFNRFIFTREFLGCYESSRYPSGSPPGSCSKINFFNYDNGFYTNSLFGNGLHGENLPPR